MSKEEVTVIEDWELASFYDAIILNALNKTDKPVQINLPFEIAYKLHSINDRRQNELEKRPWVDVLLSNCYKLTRKDAAEESFLPGQVGTFVARRGY